MRVERSRIISAPREVIWDLVRDPSHYEQVLGFGSWQPRGEMTSGIGARYRIRLPVGTILLGGEVEIVECDDHDEMAWHSVTGVDHRGRWRLRPSRRGNGTEVTLRLAYQAPGGILGLMADYVSAVYVGRLLDRALDGLDRQARRAKRQPVST
jgi:uncharacterized membrane protein